MITRCAFEFIVADEFRAEMLQVPLGHPLVLVERLVYLDSGDAGERPRAYYRADRFRFHRRLQRTRPTAGDAARGKGQAGTAVEGE